MTEEAQEDTTIQGLEHGLVTGEDIRRPFSQIIKDRYPKSSEKRTGDRRWRSRFKGTLDTLYIIYIFIYFAFKFVLLAPSG